MNLLYRYIRKFGTVIPLGVTDGVQENLPCASSVDTISDVDNFVNNKLQIQEAATGSQLVINV